MLLLTILMAVSGMAVNAAAEVLTIDEAVRLALQNNYALKAQRHTIAVSQGELLSARTFRHNPRLEVEGDAGTESNGEREDARDLAVELSQEFELGGQRRLRTRIASGALEQITWQVRNAQRQLLREVKETFYRILFLEEKHTFANQAADLAQQLLHIAEERFRVGDSPQLDVNLAFVALQNVIRRRSDVLRQLTQTRLTLNRLLGRPVDTPVVLSGTLDTPSQPTDVVQLRLQALQQRPDLQSRSAAIEVAAGEVALAKAERVPDIEVAFVFEQEEVGESVKNVFGGKISFPLPLWNRHRGEIRAAQARTRVAELERTALQAAIETEVATAVAEVDQLRTALQLFTETILPQSQENLTLLRQAFAAGEVDVITLITEQRAFIATSNEYLDTRFAYRAALANLESIVGTPLADQQSSFTPKR